MLVYLKVPDDNAPTSKDYVAPVIIDKPDECPDPLTAMRCVVVKSLNGKDGYDILPDDGGPLIPGSWIVYDDESRNLDSFC